MDVDNLLRRAWGKEGAEGRQTGCGERKLTNFQRLLNPKSEKKICERQSTAVRNHCHENRHRGVGLVGGAVKHHFHHLVLLFRRFLFPTVAAVEWINFDGLSVLKMRRDSREG